MPRKPRIDVGEVVYHVINRANDRTCFFESGEDYRDFEYLLNEARRDFKIQVLAYVIMPNHWHMLLRPKKDGDLSRALKWICTSHAVRHRTRKETIGEGHLYQGRYKSFLVEEDFHLLTVLKYIERNPVRAKLVETPALWRWGSAYRRVHGSTQEKELLAPLPVELPRNYKKWINTPEPSEELEQVRRSVIRGVSYGKVEITAQKH